MAFDITDPLEDVMEESEEHLEYDKEVKANLLEGNYKFYDIQVEDPTNNILVELHTLKGDSSTSMIFLI